MDCGGLLSRIIKGKLSNDIFNKENKTFPQEKRLLENEFSVNLPAEYKLKNKLRKSWSNVINSFRALLVLGYLAQINPTLSFVTLLRSISKGLHDIVFDFKFDDLGHRLQYLAKQ